MSLSLKAGEIRLFLFISLSLFRFLIGKQRSLNRLLGFLYVLFLNIPLNYRNKPAG
jgi:hypothetical protein